VGATAWQVVTFVSYYLTYITRGQDAAGEFTVMLRIAQPVYTLALATWAVVYTHTASAWQQGERQMATERMDMMFRRVSMMVMLAAWAIILSQPIWSRILGAKYSGAAEFLPGLLLMFAAMSNVLCLMTWGRILGCQWSLVVAAVAAGVFNVAAYYGLRKLGGVEFSSLSAGVGVFAGSVLMTVFYFARWKIKISWRSALMLLLPAILLIAGTPANSLCASAVTITACYFAFTASERKNILGKK
jgi:O-antigen/teichoic acid export membrane protein